MRLAKWIFLLAGIYGLVTLFPMYFMESTIVRATGSLDHPEYFYGFVGLALVWQVLFLVISRDPARWRPIMPVAVLEKLSFGVPVLVLTAQGRVPGAVTGFGVMDLIWGVLFLVALSAVKPEAGLARRV